MTLTEHAQLLRELALFCERLPLESALSLAARALAARARQAADEIEGRREPTDDELLAVFAEWQPHWGGTIPACQIDWSTADRLRLVLARFGGGEIEGQGEALEDAVHLLRFMCNTWHSVDRWAHANAGDAIMSYPVIQGTALQLALGRIGSQPYEQRRALAALARFGGGEGKS